MYLLANKIVDHDPAQIGSLSYPKKRTNSLNTRPAQI